jgi:transposase
MYYAGIDAHAKYLRIAVVNKVGGEIVAEKQIASRDTAALTEFLARYEGIEVVVETCPFWPWIQQVLEGAGIPFHLAHSRELRAIAHHPQKNDKVDARLLARMLSAGLIPPAWPRRRQQREWLRLLRHRVSLVRQRTQVANRIHSQLHQQGLSLPREQLLRQSGQQWVKTEAWPHLDPEQRRIVRTHLRLIRWLSQTIRGLDRPIRKAAEKNADVALLRSITGVGPFWGLMLVAELLPITRFPNAAKFVSYCGLAPRTSSSGGHTHYGSVPKEANRWVRWAIVSATATHIQRMPEGRLAQSYERLKARLGWKKARIATARRLAYAIYAMLKTNTPWREMEPVHREDELQQAHVGCLVIHNSADHPFA